MNLSFRSALLVLAALSASGVAPAQVTPGSEPLLTSNANVPAAIIVPAVLTTEITPTLALDAIPEIDPLVAVPEINAPETITPEVVTGDLSTMVAKLRGTEAGSRELECLAGAIYFESKSEPLKGQLAVGHVVANRAKSGRFPSSYCGVVYQRSQFSFVRGHAMPPIARSGLQWRNAVAIARIVDQKLQPAPMPKALFFHARRVSPGWRLARLGTIGNHVFYR